MSRFKCNQKENSCVQCGDCCRRYPMELDPQDEVLIREKIYETKGVVYPYPFKEFGLPFKPDEVERFKEIAKKKNVVANFKPLKVIIKDGKPVIIDYFLDADACPFLINNSCTIYEDRFSVCRAFPKREDFSNEFNFEHDEDLSFEDAQNIANKLRNLS